MTERQKTFLLYTRVYNCTPGMTFRTIDINSRVTMQPHGTKNIDYEELGVSSNLLLQNTDSFSGII